ncbi:MAG: hypothetical protein AAFY19_01865 [Pseudomonadota bacterium]
MVILSTRGIDALFEPRSWGADDLDGFALAFGFVYMITAFGLSVLVLLVSWFPRPSNSLVSKGLFIAAGFVLGVLMFVWTPYPLFFGVCGGLSASVFCALTPIEALDF